MPRNNSKEKYEQATSSFNTSGHLRKTTYMSPEDQASGKKSTWSELEITGTIRNLTPNLFQMSHLTGLTLKNNCLHRIPPDICHLANLRNLDLSHNKLRSLPAELGELIHLRELQLGNNLLRILPYEIGKLFNLMVLNLIGNPLSKDILTIYSEPNGTQKLLTFMLDNLQGGCKHALAFLMWMHRRTEKPSLTEVASYWKKPRLSAVGTSLKFTTVAEFSKKTVNRPVCDVSSFRSELTSVAESNDLTGHLKYTSATYEGRCLRKTVII